MAHTTQLIDIVFPGDTNHHGTLFGGIGLADMDKVAFITASRHCRKPVVLASLQRVDFVSQIQEGEAIELAPCVTSVGNTSLTAEVELWAENLLTRERRRCGVGTFIMVAVDAGHRPVLAAPPPPM